METLLESGLCFASTHQAVVMVYVIRISVAIRRIDLECGEHILAVEDAVRPRSIHIEVVVLICPIIDKSVIYCLSQSLLVEIEHAQSFLIEPARISG
jgi:hypothetical protein